MIKPDRDYRPSHTRAIYVQGKIDEQLLHKVTPELIRFQRKNRNPITVYIDSPGGSVASADHLWLLLKTSNQNFDPGCRIITVATTLAASAAADLLSSRDYALAYPHSKIAYHGTRTILDQPLTVQATSTLSQALRLRNESFAVNLLRRAQDRFIFRFLMSKAEWSKKRAAGGQMSDSDCFIALLLDQVSPPARSLVQSAQSRQGRYEELLVAVKKIREYKKVAKTDALRLKAIIDFELKENRDNKWAYRYGGLTRLTDDFFLLNEHFTSARDDRVNELCVEWGMFALSKSERDEIEKTVDPDARNRKLIKKVKPQLEPLWAFFVALCHELQEGEHELSATDAFWLGLIDEVIGAKNLPPSWRVIAEYEEDKPKGKPKEERATPEPVEAAAVVVDPQPPPEVKENGAAVATS